MAINNLSKCANSLTKMLKNKYHLKTNSKVILEMLKIIESNEIKISKFSKNFSLKNEKFFELHGQEIITQSKHRGAFAIHSYLKSKYSNIPSLSTIKRFLKEVENGKS